ncbi:MAG TPA: TetR/AcrR family transcriptional regulator [Devosia sp.]|jgi:AcrR family transcriptional regulator|nr:TetR/AcrR family transcriptional regulator [Devosia sp.]
MQSTLPSKRVSGDDRRAAIAVAAREIIVSKGLEGLRTRDIAARVGINIATLHYHVPTKEALIGLVAESIRYDFKAQAKRHSRAGKNGLEQLRLEFGDFRETVAEAPERMIVLGELGERARRDPAIAAIILPMRDFWCHQFADIFRLGREDGSLRPDIDPEAAALIATGALTECWRQNRKSLSMLDRVLAELERTFTRT